jgi:hypothetical protein
LPIATIGEFCLDNAFVLIDVALTEVVYGERQVEGAQQMSVFKRRRFPVEIILVCVRWYCKYGITYRDLAEMMQERGVDVDASTIFRWGSALRA